MDKKIIKRRIKIEFRDLLCTHNFYSQTETLYLRLTEDNILHIVAFELGSTGITCAVAMMPLYMYEHTKCISLSMGGRLSRFGVLKNEWWTYNNIDQSFVDIKCLLTNNGFPWFERYGTPKGIVDFIINNKKDQYGMLTFNIFHQKKYLGFSLLYLGRYSEGLNSIEELISQIKDDAADFMISYKQGLIELTNAVKFQPEKVAGLLIEYVNENKMAFGIK